MNDSSVAPYADLFVFPDVYLVDPGGKILNTGLCYVCATPNGEKDHAAPDGWPLPCPTGITRDEADDIRRARGEKVPDWRTESP